MTARANMSTPTAILMGSLIVAVGVYLGMRERIPVPAPAPMSDVAAPHQAPSPAPSVTAREVVTEQAKAALAYHHALLRDRCYRPTVAGETPPRPAKWMLNVTFDAQGVQLTRGLVELRGRSISTMSECLSELLPSLRVPPPGAVTMVEIPVEFP